MKSCLQKTVCGNVDLTSLSHNRTDVRALVNTILHIRGFLLYLSDCKLLKKDFVSCS
jgi:hypothetical protein